MKRLVISTVVFVSILLFLPFGVIGFYYQGVPMTCENNCAPPNDWCNPNAASDPCCQTLKKTGDPFACPWPQRGYCKDDECAAIPKGVNSERCGVPRHHWCDLCQGSCCTNADYSINHIPEAPPPDFSKGCPPTIQWAPGHGPQSTPTPTKPVGTPKPTRTPTPKPTGVTATPTGSQPTPTGSAPTSTPTTAPTEAPDQPPVAPLWPTAELWPTDTPYPQQPIEQTPGMTFVNPLPTVVSSVSQATNKTIETADRELPRSLDILAFFFKRALYYDKLLEYTINTNVRKVFTKKTP